MLFSDFFPRLRDQAWHRYGQTITERQFKDWREDGLLPGPAPPKGRGRGRSPERHWPVTSYRRALRICRYKSWGANRQSQWWLGFWLSGELVEPSKIRNALKREFSIERRTKYSFIESNRWRNAKFKTVEDAERGGLPGDSSVAGLLAITKMTPDQFRRVSILELDEFSDVEAEKLIHEIAPVIFGFDAKTTAAIQADIVPDEIKQLWRPGHMAEGTDKPGKYLDGLPDSDFAIGLQILKLREQSAIWNYGISWLLGNRLPDQIAINILPVLASRVHSLEHRISHLNRIAFEISADANEHISATQRLVNVVESNSQLRSILQAIALNNPRKVIE